MNKFSFGIVIFIISIILTISNVESVAADSVKFDQLNFIINDHTDIISLVDEVPYETGTTVLVTLDSSDTNPSKPFVLTEDVPGSHIFRTIVKFSTTCTLPCASNELKVSTGDTVTLSKSGLASDTITMKAPTGETPMPQYGNNKFTTNAANCNSGLGGDSDGDGICNNWEGPNGLSISFPTGGTYSIGISPNVPGLYELRAPSSTQKDIYLEIDYMQGHRPNVEAIWDVINGFNAMGITLHIQLDDEGGTGTLIPHATCTRWPGLNFPTASKGFDQIAGTYFGTSSERTGDWTTNGWIRKHQVFHYTLFTHAQCGSTSSGVAEIGGDELMVTLGVLTDDLEPVGPDQISGTLMHELGHNLNLNHGGAYSDTKNCKPTHMSVMSYSRQWTDLVPNRNLEFSRQAVDLEGSATLIENSLNENLGLDTYPDPLEEITWGVPPGTPPLIRAIVGAADVDWDQDGNTETTIPTQNLNTFSADGDVVCPQSDTNEPLLGHNDVAVLVYNIRTDGDWQDGRSVGGGTIIESPFCLATERVTSLLPTGSPLINFFNSLRSCAGGAAITDLPLILAAHQNATQFNGTVSLAILQNFSSQVLNQSSDELTPNDMITMRLSRIDSIMAYLDKTPNNHFTEKNKIKILQDYADETDKIKNDIKNHKLLSVLDRLQKLYDSYPQKITNLDTSEDLQRGTADIYNSINKVVLSSPISTTRPPPSVIFPPGIVVEDIPDIMILHPELFENGVIKTDYPDFIKNGKFLISKWKIEKEGNRVVGEDITYLKPIKMLKIVDKTELICNKDLVPLEKPNSESVICVKDSTKKKLEPIWHPTN